MLVPLTVTLVYLITNAMHFHNFNARLHCVNTALKELRNVMMWWDSLDTSVQRMKHMKEHLVDVTEIAMLADFSVTQRTPPRPRNDQDNVGASEKRSNEFEEESE